MHLLIGSVVLVDRGINLQRNVWLVLILYGIYQSSIVYIEVLVALQVKEQIITTSKRKVQFKVSCNDTCSVELVIISYYYQVQYIIIVPVSS